MVNPLFDSPILIEGVQSIPIEGGGDDGVFWDDKVRF